MEFLDPSRHRCGWIRTAALQVPQFLHLRILPWMTCVIVALISSMAQAEPGHLPDTSWATRSSRTAHPAVARIIASETDGTSHGSGTLVAVTDQYGLVVTNWHVIRGAVGPVLVQFPDGFQSAARVAKWDRDWDLAALIIWKPQAQPVSLSRQVPRPGELLTIAGYGSGNYRAATGRCTQYVAPASNLPYEMIEISAEARNGDSGGPIFNEHGQLAGVLFGATQGTTAGSHCQRVGQFLHGVVPPNQSAAAESALADNQRRPARALPSTTLPIQGTQESPAVVALDPRPRASDSARFRSTPTTPLDQPTATAESSSVQLKDLMGTTVFEQAKSFLAIFGLVALALHLGRRKE